LTDSQPLRPDPAALSIEGCRRKRAVNPAGLFALEVTKVQIARRITNAELVERLRTRGYRGTRQLIGYYVGGRRAVPPEAVEHIGRALELPDDRVTRLHCAAAMDRGYRVGLDGRGLDGRELVTNAGPRL
jgi:hypothetical protein